MYRLKISILIIAVISFYIAMVIIAILDYPITSILAPTTLIFGWIIWQQQELAKRRSDAAENLLESYWKYEKYITSIYLTYSSIIREDPYSVTLDRVKELLNSLDKDVKLCLESEIDFHLATNLFFFKTININQYDEITKFKNIFYKYNYVINLSDKILNMNLENFDFVLFGKVINDLRDDLKIISFSEIGEIEPLPKAPRKQIEELTKKYLNLEIPL